MSEGRKMVEARCQINHDEGVFQLEELKAVTGPVRGNLPTRTKISLARNFVLKDHDELGF